MFNQTFQKIWEKLCIFTGFFQTCGKLIISVFFETCGKFIISKFFDKYGRLKSLFYFCSEDERHKWYDCWSTS